MIYINFILKSVLIWISNVKPEVHFISTSRLMMAYGLGRNIALLLTSLQSFQSPQLINGIKQ